MCNPTKMSLTIALMAALALGCGDEDSNETVNAGAGDEGGTAGETASENGWNAVCAESADCAEPTNFCAKQPGEDEGYCTIPCETTADCPYGEWSCNVIGGCAAPAATWCGPRAEVEMFTGIIEACD